MLECTRLAQCVSFYTRAPFFSIASSYQGEPLRRLDERVSQDTQWLPVALGTQAWLPFLGVWSTSRPWIVGICAAACFSLEHSLEEEKHYSFSSTWGFLECSWFSYFMFEASPHLFLDVSVSWPSCGSRLGRNFCSTESFCAVFVKFSHWRFIIEPQKHVRAKKTTHVTIYIEKLLGNSWKVAIFQSIWRGSISCRG